MANNNDMIMISEYAELVGREMSTIRKKCIANGFKTAEKRGKFWFISRAEPYTDNRTVDNRKPRAPKKK